MLIEIFTKEDLLKFKSELIQEIKAIVVSEDLKPNHIISSQRTRLRAMMKRSMISNYQDNSIPVNSFPCIITNVKGA